VDLLGSPFPAHVRVANLVYDQDECGWVTTRRSGVAASIGGGMIAYRMIERPVLRDLKRLKGIWPSMASAN
jgi:peptidoglycan/LPS O-acetylase OafA/YrhL